MIKQVGKRTRFCLTALGLRNTLTIMGAHSALENMPVL